MSIVIDPNKGLTIPVLTTTQKNAIVSPNTGAMLYDSSLGRVEVYNTSNWKLVGIDFIESYFFRSTRMTGGNNPAVGQYTGSSTVAERRSVNIPAMQLRVNSSSLISPTTLVTDLNTSGNWDSATYATAANRAGKDFYVYACVPTSGTVPDFVLSASTTYPSAIPSGVTPSATNTRKVGGFHCLCVAVGTISGHDLTGYLAGDILPRSCWDLQHKPISSVEGMVYGKHGQWVDIYLPSVTGGELVSVNGGTIADGVSATAFHAYKFDQWFGRIGKKSIASLEFVAASIGANQSTNIAGSADPGITGGHTDTAGRRMISNIGCEDMCGVMWQWGREQGAIAGSAAWANAYDANDSSVGGQHYNAPTRPKFGGGWNDGVVCGSRSSYWADGALILISTYASRGCAEPA